MIWAVRRAEATASNEYLSNNLLSAKNA
jgi:hypothetical protein